MLCPNTKQGHQRTLSAVLDDPLLPAWDSGFLTLDLYSPLTPAASLNSSPVPAAPRNCLRPPDVAVLAGARSAGDGVHSDLQVPYIRMQLFGSPAQKRINISDL